MEERGSTGKEVACNTAYRHAPTAIASFFLPSETCMTRNRRQVGTGDMPVATFSKCQVESMCSGPKCVRMSHRIDTPQSSKAGWAGVVGGWVGGWTGGGGLGTWISTCHRPIVLESPATYQAGLFQSAHRDKRMVDGCRILVYSSACSQLFGGWGCGLERVFHLAFHVSQNHCPIIPSLNCA